MEVEAVLGVLQGPELAHHLRAIRTELSMAQWPARASLTTAPACSCSKSTILHDPQRLNVASRRAKGALVTVALPRLFAPEVRTPE